jgi:hypothetical protein
VRRVIQTVIIEIGLRKKGGKNCEVLSFDNGMVTLREREGVGDDRIRR